MWAACWQEGSNAELTRRRESAQRAPHQEKRHVKGSLLSALMATGQATND